MLAYGFQVILGGIVLLIILRVTGLTQSFDRLLSWHHRHMWRNLGILGLAFGLFTLLDDAVHLRSLHQLADHEAFVAVVIAYFAVSDLLLRAMIRGHTNPDK